jgi:hypothetical protein
MTKRDARASCESDRKDVNRACGLACAAQARASTWTAEDRRWLMNLYTEQEIRAFERAGDYLGWRAGIRNDGKWLFFVAGD